MMTKNHNTIIFYFTEGELEISKDFNKFAESPPLIMDYGNNSFIALEQYANIPCPHSELIQSDTPEEQHKKILESLKNHKDPEWVKNYFNNL